MISEEKRMTSVRAAMISFFGGALSFWLPDVALFIAFDRSGYRWVWVWMTIACPTTALLFYWWLLRGRSGTVGPSSALYQFLGIWMLAPWFMILASFLANGFRADLPIGELPFLVFTTFIPVWTVPASAMQGSGFGLALITIPLPLLHVRNESDRWLIPPRLAFWRKGHSTFN
jgi:hypothetical protein